MTATVPDVISVSVREAARLTSFSEYEIRRAISAGELPAVRRDVRIAILTADLERWLRSLPKASDVEPAASLTSTVMRNITALIAARGMGFPVDCVEHIADLFGVPGDRLFAKDFDPSA